MFRIIVHVKRKDERNGRDLEIPAEVPAAELSQLIARALKWPNSSSEIEKDRVSYLVYASPPGRLLHPHETLADVEAWDGAELLLMVSQAGKTEVGNSSPKLHLDSDSGKSYVIRGHSCILGRKSNMIGPGELLIDLVGEKWGKSVSRRHAQLQLYEDGWKLKPLHGEINRTLINEEKVLPGEWHAIESGDIIVVGRVSLKVRG